MIFKTIFITIILKGEQVPLVSFLSSSMDGPILPHQASPPLHWPLCEKPQACPPALTKSRQKAINILKPPSAPTTKPPKGPTLFPPQCRLQCCSRLARGFHCFISQCPGGQLWFSRGHGVGDCGQEGPPLLLSIKYYSPGLRAPVAAALAPSNAAAYGLDLTRDIHPLCRLSIH